MRSLRLRLQRQGGLWRNAGFMRLWAGETVSVFGSQITYLALPLTAILILKARPFALGVLMAAASAPYLLFGLPAGAWVDRHRRRPILIVADVARALLLASIPLAAWLGLLSIGQLAAVAFLSGVLTLLFGIAHGSFLPSLVREDQLIEGNSKLEISSSIAGIAGPGLGGAVVQLLTAPVAILLDAVSFVLSALCLVSIRATETAPATPTHQRAIQREIAEGLRLVFGSPILRPLALSSATFNFFDSALMAVYILYMTRTLHLPAAAVGLVFGIAGFGGLLGAAAAAPATRWLGVGRVMVGGVALAGVAELAIAAVAGPLALAVLLLILAEGSVQLGALLYRINSRSLRQRLTPDRLLGRVSATSDFLTQGVGPPGALLGGFLGQTIGLRGTVMVAGVGTLFAFVWVLASPVRRLGDPHPPAPSPIYGRGGDEISDAYP